MRLFFVLAGFLLSTSVLAQTPTPPERLKAQADIKALVNDPVALRQAIDAGKKVTFFCVNCHGENGISKMTEVPNLAGQNAAYVLEQIRKFGAGERKNQFMEGLIKVLKDDERLQAAQYYASMPVPPSPTTPALAAKGKALFTKLCVQCHGVNARGSELFPRLAGQQIEYLRLSITRYRDGTGIRNEPRMTIATSMLKDADIIALANYLRQLP
ncbi:MAG: c-type cytochrome [Azonexus sp.]|jgi:cytochrome c553|nr:c-type cytochrome [Azonexus sp.]